MAGAPPTVYVPIGLAKTGTTYLQQLMWDNRESLARSGLLYPGRRRTFAAGCVRAYAGCAVL